MAGKAEADKQVDDQSDRPIDKQEERGGDDGGREGVEGQIINALVTAGD